MLLPESERITLSVRSILAGSGPRFAARRVRSDARLLRRLQGRWARRRHRRGDDRVCRGVAVRAQARSIGPARVADVADRRRAGCDRARGRGCSRLPRTIRARERWCGASCSSARSRSGDHSPDCSWARCIRSPIEVRLSMTFRRTFSIISIVLGAPARLPQRDAARDVEHVVDRCLRRRQLRDRRPADRGDDGAGRSGTRRLRSAAVPSGAGRCSSGVSRGMRYSRRGTVERRLAERRLHLRRERVCGLRGVPLRSRRNRGAV